MDIAYRHFAGTLTARYSVLHPVPSSVYLHLDGGHMLIDMGFFSYSLNLTYLLQILPKIHPNAMA
jgi:hypothetical protein